MRRRQPKRDGVYWRGDAKKFYLSYVDARGERQRIPGAANEQEARDALTRIKAKILEERTQRASLKAGEMMPCEETFSDVADKFLAYQQARLKSDAGYERERGIVCYHLKPYFAGKLADVTPAQASDYVTARLGKVSAGSVRKELVTLKHLFRLACGEWKLLPRFANPTLDVRAPKVHDERSQHMSQDQFRRLLAASPEKMKPIFALLTSTGMRRSELLNCKWGWVEQSRILLPTSKNDDPKEVHLNVFAQAVLASIPHGRPEDLLFPGVTKASVSVAFHRLCQKLRIEDIRLHDCRHTFATWLPQRGTELDIIAAQLGHRDLRMTKRYAKIAAAQVKQAVAGIDADLGEMPEPGSPQVSHLLVTAPEPQKEGNDVTDLESWRPRRDLNPCYRRERAVSWAGLDDGDDSQRNANTALKMPSYQ